MCEEEYSSTTSLVVEAAEHVKYNEKKYEERARRRLTRRKKTSPTPKLLKKHYFTAAVNVNDDNQRDVLSEQSPFRYPKDLEMFALRVMSKAWRENLRKEELTLKYNQRHNYVSRGCADILNRLYVKEPEMQDMQTILDTDPNFYSVVDGRPVPQKFDQREYICDARDVLRTKIVTGYREDETLLIEQNLNMEQEMIDAVNKEFKTYVDSFEQFLAADHESSMALLKRAEKEAALTLEKEEALNELSKSYGALKSIVYNLEEKWRNCKMYQGFLYLVSPLSWRVEHDFYYKRENQADENDVEAFAQYRLTSLAGLPSLDCLIDQFLIDIEAHGEPQLYFTDPTELVKAFRFIEIQNLNSLLHSEELAVPLENVREGMEISKKKFNLEITALIEVINELEGGILWEEERAQFLEALAMELINGEFKDLIAKKDVLNLYVFVEDVYESRVGPNDASLTSGEMMKAVESKYRESLLKLDRMPQEIVHKAEMESYVEEAKTLRVAKQAAKQVVQIERLMKAMARLLQPVIPRTTRDLRWRSCPPDTLVITTVTLRYLTEDEKQKLIYYSDRYHNTDDVQLLETMIQSGTKELSTELQE